MQRVIAYIDGFNLYYGLRARYRRRFIWLDLREMVSELLKDDQALVKIKYFTAMVSSTPRDPQKNRRQVMYLDALQTLPDLEVHYGHYLHKRVVCYRCRRAWDAPEEKMTDVNIASEMLFDAFADDYDTAFLVSGDSDLARVVQRIRGHFGQKRIVVAFPPKRESAHLKRSASAYLTIGRTTLARSQFPERVTTDKGFVLERPSEWK